MDILTSEILCLFTVNRGATVMADCKCPVLYIIYFNRYGITAILRLLVSIDTKKKNKVVNLLLMPYRKISRDIRLAAICLYEQELLPLDDILDCLGFHECTFYRILALWRGTGDVIKHKSSGKYPKNLASLSWISPSKFTHERT